MPKVTINDISREAGVSIATVSRVLNRKGNVSKQVEARVLNAIDKLDYKLPLSCKHNRSKLIAVIVPKFSNPFYNDIYDGIQDVANRYKYNMIVTQTKTEFGLSTHTAEFLKGNLVDGIITLEHAGNLHSLLTDIDPSVPIVQCCEYDESLPYPYVSIDNFNATVNTVHYLVNTGRNKIAFLNSTTRSTYGKMREEGYKYGLQSQGLSIDNHLIYHLNIIDFNVAYSASLKLFSEAERPDAIVCVSDIYAAAAMRAAHKLDLRIPQDIAIVGFDNIDFTVMCEPPLTTVNQPRYEIGSTACTTLFRLINKQPPMSNKLLLESELIVRGTT